MSPNVEAVTCADICVCRLWCTSAWSCWTHLLWSLEQKYSQHHNPKDARQGVPGPQCISVPIIFTIFYSQSILTINWLFRWQLISCSMRLSWTHCSSCLLVCSQDYRRNQYIHRNSVFYPNWFLFRGSYGPYHISWVFLCYQGSIECCLSMLCSSFTTYCWVCLWEIGFEEGLNIESVWIEQKN